MLLLILGRGEVLYTFASAYYTDSCFTYLYFCLGVLF
jgi:hypothetical protein